MLFCDFFKFYRYRANRVLKVRNLETTPFLLDTKFSFIETNETDETDETAETDETNETNMISFFWMTHLATRVAFYFHTPL